MYILLFKDASFIDKIINDLTDFELRKQQNENNKVNTYLEKDIRYLKSFSLWYKN